MFDNREGQPVPNATFKTRTEHDWKEVTTADLFAGKTVIVFSLPGAFTPTCSSAHVPRYNQLAPVFRANGVDDIICMSVNDAFVMNEWQEEQCADEITFIPDGNGEFTDGMGLLVPRVELGFGNRSWRYSMLVKDGVIVKQFIEPEKPGDPFEVSDADTMLAYVNPEAGKPADITLFTRKGCGFCAKAKGLLRERDMKFEELRLGKEITGTTMRAIAHADTFPQVFVDGQLIGGADELERWLTAA